ncbi:hypothetical protein ABR776_12505 [Bacillus cereus]|uniref:hypothetical protein n=1 Tax=Bacillus cereus group TaxID=86661 RepID=UPI001F586DE1|nr:MULTISPECIES: hypothetical protein [Bacillus cereus group]
MKRKIGLATDEVKCLTERTKVRSSALRRLGMTELEYAKTIPATILVVNIERNAKNLNNNNSFICFHIPYL